jgi:DtxR family transcriptional regulator, Mn-dependent transcriptional regulator
MTEVLTQSIQDYLKHIYDLSADGTPASTNDLASRLGIAPASVTGMVQRLASAAPPLILYKKHQGVTLTHEGERAALEVIRHHRLLEAWLVQTLGYSWDEVHEEAERLEHVISEDFERRIAAAMGNPVRDPHGDLIPSADLTMPSEDARPLISLRTGEAGTVKRVNGADPAFLRHLQGLGLVPGAQVHVREYSEFDGNLTLEVNGQPAFVVGPAITKQIFV